MTTPSRATVVLYPDELEIIAPFNRDYIDDLKAAHIGARFEPTSKSWAVDISRFDKALKVVHRYYDRVLFVEPGFPDPARATLHLRPDAPMQVIAAAYKALSLLHHPDRGGSTEKMQQINSAYASLRKKEGSHDL